MDKKLNANESFRLWMNGIGEDNIKKNLESNVTRDEQGRILISKDDEWCLDVREVRLYQKYKHFKGNKIITIGISKPINIKLSKEYEVITAYEVVLSCKNGWREIFIETDKEGNLYHSDRISKKQIIIYKILNMNKQIFGRTEEEFLSKVNKAKYPDCKQEYILEELQ